MGQRRRARERAFQVVFSQLFTGFSPDIAIARTPAATATSAEQYARQLVECLAEQRAPVEDAIRSSLENWTLERIMPSDGALLRLGATELMFFKDVPAAVAINEYVELAKRYGDDDSPSFVNAVLDRIRKNVAAQPAPPGKPQE